MKHVVTRLAILMLLVASVAVAGEARLATAGGQVSAIDAASKSLTVKVAAPSGEAKDMTFMVADDSKILKNGAVVGLNDLVKGDKVTVTYKSMEGKNVVVNIGVDSKG